MSDLSATCPMVEVRSDSLSIGDPSDPHGDLVRVELYDVDALISTLLEARNRLVRAGVNTAWSADADGHGNCGPVPSTGQL